MSQSFFVNALSVFTGARKKQKVIAPQRQGLYGYLGYVCSFLKIQTQHSIVFQDTVRGGFRPTILPIENLQGCAGCAIRKSNHTLAGIWTLNLEVLKTAFWPLGYNDWKFPCKFSMGKIVGQKSPWDNFITLTVCCVHCSHNLFNLPE